jgi:transposase
MKGFSKDKRCDLLQVVIGLAVTREGIPIRSWVWPGNTSDMFVVEEVKKDLIGWKLARVISVMDRGFSSEDNLRYLQRAGGHYIVGEKIRSGKGDTEEALSRKGRYSQVRDNLQIKEMIVGEGEGRKIYVLVYNPQEAKREKIKRDEITKNLTEELKNLKQLPSQALTKASCKLRTNKVYGKYIRTSDDTLSSEDVALGYRQLADVENAFRTLKTTLELRPMYHRKEERIRSHIFLCWLALLLVRIAEKR